MLLRSRLAQLNRHATQLLVDVANAQQRPPIVKEGMRFHYVRDNSAAGTKPPAHDDGAEVGRERESRPFET